MAFFNIYNIYASFIAVASSEYGEIAALLPSIAPAVFPHISPSIIPSFVAAVIAAIVASAAATSFVLHQRCLHNQSPGSCVCQVSHMRQAGAVALARWLRDEGWVWVWVFRDCWPTFFCCP